MDAFTKPKRPRQADDRLSALPDELLRAILSRLKALQMAQTCVLSTRWRSLWRAVPCLHIDDGDFTSGPPYFQNFTTNLLRSHSVALLEDFRLHATWERWDWDLVRSTILQDIGTSSWPCRLKILRLSNLDDLNLNDLASHINSRCPALEEVRLENCYFLTTGNVKIASSSLKKLVIDFNYDEDGDDIFAFIIEAPALVSLRLTADELAWILDTTEPHTMPSLVDASIQLDFYFATTAHESYKNTVSLHESNKFKVFKYGGIFDSYVN
ncbi:F-box/LRR-repeat protein At3g26922-like [Aegilops tauschii subsp. strangulata]|uniref:F-box/LRR-repeat protein At3g26922-like n=1 Tax=Aegilops tauschii subsp. strangulata TaxID=200361 RepID=UPI00098A81AF|nr:putative F-box/FBD/LRR-repeat protein At3g49030 [Aegilops tauschii subsp. strangulata]